MIWDFPPSATYGFPTLPCAALPFATTLPSDVISGIVESRVARFL